MKHRLGSVKGSFFFFCLYVLSVKMATIHLYSYLVGLMVNLA